MLRRILPLLFALLAANSPASAAISELPVLLVIPGGAGLQVVPPPESSLVSDLPNTLTIYNAPLDHDTIGLVAHNYLAGGSFYQLEVGDYLQAQYSAWSEWYRVTEIRQYRALGDQYPYYEFIDLVTGETITDMDVFGQVYDRPGAIVLQTCLSRDGKPDWGLTFWIAYPDSGPVMIQASSIETKPLPPVPLMVCRGRGLCVV